MSTLVITPCVADANARAACSPRPLRGPLCLWSSSPQQLGTCAIPLRSSPLGLSRGFVRGSEFTRGSIRGARADSETEERPIRTEANGRARGLDELDNQLRSLSSSDNLTSAAKQATEENVEELPREEKKGVDWPEVNDGFVWYISVGLLLLTIINNILFKIFLGPPVQRAPLPQGTEVPQGTPSDLALRERFKLRSYKDPIYQNRAPPTVTDGPRS